MPLTIFRTNDGHPFVQIAHITLAMLPAEKSSPKPYRVLIAQGAKHPDQCTATDFHSFMKAVNDEAEFLVHAQELSDHYKEIALLVRQDISKQRGSPWGASQTRTQYYKGVELVSCAGHGGFLLSPSMNDLVDPDWKNPRGAYEEDQQWAVVAFTFPHLFTQYEMRKAVETLKNDFPDTYERLTGTTVSLDESQSRRRAAFHTKHAQDFIVISASRSKKDPSMVFCTAAIGGRGDDYRRIPSTQSFLVDAAEYNAGYLPYGFVIDESRHQRVDASEHPLQWQSAA